MPENPLPQRDEKPLGPSNWVRDLVKDNPLAPKPTVPGATPTDLKTPLPTPAGVNPAPLGAPVPPLVDAAAPVTPVVNKPVAAPAQVPAGDVADAPTPTEAAPTSTATPPPVAK
jgi:hypothetical protein